MKRQALTCLFLFAVDKPSSLSIWRKMCILCKDCLIPTTLAADKCGAVEFSSASKTEGLTNAR